MRTSNQTLVNPSIETKAENRNLETPFKFSVSQLKGIIRIKRLVVDNKACIIGFGLILAYFLDRKMSSITTATSSIGSAGILYGIYYVKSILDMNFKFERDIEAEETMR
jgi:hypothetical protein